MGSPWVGPLESIGALNSWIRGLGGEQELCFDVSGKSGWGASGGVLPIGVRYWLLGLLVTLLVFLLVPLLVPLLLLSVN